MTIKRDTTSEPILGMSTTAKKPQAYCPSCAMKGLRGADYILQPRIYPVNNSDLLPNDADNWLQCYVCGTIIPKYDVPQTGQLTSDVETITSKFPNVDAEKAEDLPERDPHKRGFNPRDKRLSGSTVPATVKEQEVIRALRKGSKLISYSET